MQIAQALGRLLARRRRQPAPRDGQEEGGGDGGGARALPRRRGASRARPTDKLAGEIFDQMETFAAYGFNKSHSAAYAVITYQTAYLKAHYPTEFMAGLLSLEAGDTDSTYKNIAECRERGIAILPPDVNESREDFTAAGAAIRFGLGAVKGVGSKAIEAIIVARGRRAVHEPARLLPARARPAGEPARAREPDQVRRLRLARAQPGAAARRPRRRRCAGRSLRAEERDQPADGPLRRRRGRTASRRRRRCRRRPLEGRGGAARASARRIGFFITGHPLDRYEQDLREFTNVTVGTLRTRGAELPPVASSDPAARASPARPARRRDPHVKLSNTRRATATRPSCSRTRKASSR